ncbi:hypothetical protein ACO0LB_17740 [Undibacterium sp. SXout7W]|uniref:hypothetical protein n=1 Tax=Undibacterium sp. SXout7W TaxID=3413049 RepID=UPI003BF327BD
MKREPKVTIEELTPKFMHVDLTPLNGRLSGQSLIAFEHCLIEILGELFDQHRIYLSVITELATECIDAESRSNFVRSHSEYNHRKGDYLADNANFSLAGRYFYRLNERLCDLEDKLHSEGKPNTIGPARQLVAIILRQMQTMFNAASFQNYRLNQCFDSWMATQ